MSRFTDADLYRRGVDTLVASWEAYAREAVDATLLRAPGVAIAIFPNEPERSVYNNALFESDLTAVERANAIQAMEVAYGTGGITRFAAWVHETDETLRKDLGQRGYTIDTSTRAMGVAADDQRVPRPVIDLAPPDWDEYLRVIEVAPELLSAGDHAAFHVAIARIDGESAAAAMAFDFAGDCGLYNVGTLERFRRRGLGSALTAVLVHDAFERGCETASLQSTPMAERVYTSVGFRDLGRFVELVR